MIKKKYNDEVDILELIVIIWNKKLQIIFIVLAAIILAYIFQTYKEPEKTIIISEIKPITVYEETKYTIYNSFVNSIRVDYLNNNNTKNFNNNNEIIEIPRTNKNERTFYELKDLRVDKLLINNIDKEFLFQLFVDRISEKSFLIDLIKKYNFFNKEDFDNNLKYEEAVSNIASNIKFSDKSGTVLTDGPLKLITFKTINIEKWGSFLKFLETEANKEIQEILSEMFYKHISYSKKLKKYVIEDIENRLDIKNTSEIEKDFLIKQKSLLIKNNYEERIENIYADSPMADKIDFRAARINYDSLIYQENNKSTFKVLVLIGIISTVFAIFFVLILNAIQNRR